MAQETMYHAPMLKSIISLVPFWAVNSLVVPTLATGVKRPFWELPMKLVLSPLYHPSVSAVLAQELALEGNIP